MEKKDIFVKGTYDRDIWFAKEEKTLRDVMKEYNEEKASYEKYRDNAEELKSKMEKQSFDVKEMNLKTQEKLYSAVDRSIASSRYDDENELIELRKEMRENFGELKEYRNALSYRNSRERSMKEILDDDITFNNMDRKKDSIICNDKHFFVRTEDGLKCIACGATTKDYDLTNEELDFLTECAKKQCILLKNATENDIPLVQLLINELEAYKKQLTPLEEYDDDHYMDEAEERALGEESEVSFMNATVIKSHKFDERYEKGYYDWIKVAKYLDDKTANKLLRKIYKSLCKVMQSDSKQKDLMIEAYNTVKYEVLILNGKLIPELFENAKTEDDKVALTKAYYNLRNNIYCENTTYFKNERDARSYSCYTAVPEINELVTVMKNR